MGIIEMLFLGIGLSMDASAVSMTNGLSEPKMNKGKVFLIAAFFGVFQGVMPLIGYAAGSVFTNFISQFTPWLALVLLSFIGGKMLIEGIKEGEEKETKRLLGWKELFIQAIATSIDALTVGIIFVGKEPSIALKAALIITITTFSLSYIAVYIGKKFGTLLSNKAQIFGGVILIGIGLKVFIEYIITLF